ncbi:alpha/beta hydrolase fold domain-containing protein [Kordia sp.]|uniref:alpha/beta hydrolase fold domain-containing protein n=1 Tax=Kordia sp. TaxID=1965332 RepID=UPI003D6A57CE
MKQSLSYYLTKIVIKLKGIKKTFSQDPIDFKKIRNEDIHFPKSRFFKKYSKKFQIENTIITEVKTNNATNKLVLFIHGGAFISGPVKHHWDTIKTIARNGNCVVWMCDYPKAPEYKIKEISKNIDAVYHQAMQAYKPSQITLLGDSVGGTLITALTQRLLTQKIALPQKLILICPVMDATMQNPEIETLDEIDPILSKVGVLSAKKMCVGEKGLNNPIISPLHGSFTGFPKTILCVADHDIMYPDQLITIDKMKQSEVPLTIIKGENMPHIWPLLPVMKEAKNTLQELISHLNK